MLNYYVGGVPSGDPMGVRCPIFRSKLKNPKGGEAQLSHVMFAWAFLSWFSLKMQNLLLPSKLLGVTPLRGEAAVALCSSLFLLHIPIMALYGMNKLGRQFNWNCLKQRVIMIFHSECKSDNNSSWVLLINWLDYG